ncbi:hypothetical protein K8I31_19420 [bacterium]|nr:hypothetical protein [bacterium]
MPNVFTVTLNPVVDLIYCVNQFEKGDTFRCNAFECVPAGKGLNVSTVLAALGVPSSAYMLLGEEDEHLYRRYCEKRNVDLVATTGPFTVRLCDAIAPSLKTAAASRMCRRAVKT